MPIVRRSRSTASLPYLDYEESEFTSRPDYFRTPRIQTRTIFDDLVKECFKPARVQIKRSQSTLDTGAVFIPEREPQVFRPTAPYMDPLLVKRASPAYLREAYNRYNFNVLYGNRRYYSRYSLGDTGYFDWDLKHSIDSERGWTLPHKAPNHPYVWEHRYLTGLARTQGFTMVSPNLFIRRNQYTDWRDYATSVLAGALRSDEYWKWRYTNIKTPYYTNRSYLPQSLGLPYMSSYNLYGRTPYSVY